MWKKTKEDDDKKEKDEIVEKLAAILKHLFEIRGWGCQELTLPRQLSTFGGRESRLSWLKTARKRNAGKRGRAAAAAMKTDWRYIEVFTIFSFPVGDPTVNCKNQRKLNNYQNGRTRKRCKICMQILGILEENQAKDDFPIPKHHSLALLKLDFQKC